MRSFLNKQTRMTTRLGMRISTRVCVWRTRKVLSNNCHYRKDGRYTNQLLGRKDFCLSPSWLLRCETSEFLISQNNNTEETSTQTKCPSLPHKCAVNVFGIHAIRCSRAEIWRTERRTTCLGLSLHCSVYIQHFKDRSSTDLRNGEK